MNGNRRNVGNPDDSVVVVVSYIFLGESAGSSLPGAARQTDFVSVFDRNFARNSFDAERLFGKADSRQPPAAVRTAFHCVV